MGKYFKSTLPETLNAFFRHLLVYLSLRPYSDFQIGIFIRKLVYTNKTTNKSVCKSTNHALLLVLNEAILQIQFEIS
jgi:hypothetical protein